MAHPVQKSSIGQRTLGIGSGFAAGAVMLSHMNRSGLSRYDDMIADLSRLQNPPQRTTKRADRPHAQQRMRWISWIYR